MHQREIARFVHAQMIDHYWEDAVEYEVIISKGFCELKQCAYTTSPELQLDFRQSPADKSNMAKYLFSGFTRCLYSVQKFQSDSERKLAVILEREAIKWFKPAKGQFLIYYRSGADHLEYQPDFVAEADGIIYMLEPKARNEMNAADVLAKKEAAIRWCKQASDYAQTCGGKPWKYVLIPHDAIAENMTLEALAGQFAVW
jgi:type III restriction enzyme